MPLVRIDALTATADRLTALGIAVHTALIEEDSLADWPFGHGTAHYLA